MTFLFVKYFNNSTKSTDTSSAFMDIKNAHHMALIPPPFYSPILLSVLFLTF